MRSAAAGAVETGLTLESAGVRLRPMEEADIAELGTIAFDRAIWKHYLVEILEPRDLQAYMDESLAAQRSGQRMVFSIIDKTTGRLCGSTCFGNISEKDSRIEIGWSWLGTGFQGTHVNREAKFLLIRHAFETKKFLRVEFKTDVLNLRARAALNRIGCTEEGILRSHTLMHGGRRRDTIYYSILASEWPAIKAERFAGAA